MLMRFFLFNMMNVFSFTILVLALSIIMFVKLSRSNIDPLKLN